MTLDGGLLRDRVRDLALATGHFEKVEGHEPPSPPGKGVRGAVWIEDTDIIDSGLDVVSVRVLIILRVSLDLSQGTSEDRDRIDPRITDAAYAVAGALAVDYTLSSACRNIDFHGEEGERLRLIGGYFEHQEQKYRAVMVRIPCLVDDVWTIGGS